MPHLYNTLFYDNSNSHYDPEDIPIEIVNQLLGCTNNLNSISNYYDIATYNNLFAPDKKFNTLHINSRSLPKYIDKIKAFLNILFTTPDILVAPET